MGTNDKHDIAKNMIDQEINTVMMMPTRVRENGCVACHDQNLNEKFIDVVEKIHIKQRIT
jgi:hypothetical protein